MWEKEEWQEAWVRRRVGGWKAGLSPCCSHRDSSMALADLWKVHSSSFLNPCSCDDQFTVMGSEMGF